MPDICVTRQPVFDRTETAVAYELRLRLPGDGSDPLATSVLTGSFDLLRSGLTAWVRVTREQLLADVCSAGDAKALTVLVPADIGIDDAVIATVTALAARGVGVALDEFEFPEDAGAPVYRLLQAASMVRVDLRCQSMPALPHMLKTLKAMGKRAAADHVSDATVYRDCLAAGFDAFQGSHFTRPEPLPLAALPVAAVTGFRLLAMARDPDTPDRALEDTISTDPGITFQLLRIANSAAVGGSDITSIAHALRLVGRANLMRWLGLAIAASHAGAHGPANELIRQAIQRARFCESLATPANGFDRGALFLIGLFSLLDAVFRMPMSEILDRVSLSSDFRDALIDRSGAYADPLELVELYELGLWQGAAEAALRVSIDPARLAPAYTDALKWADEQMPAGNRPSLARAS